MIQFYRGLKTKYNLATMQDAIFFATDTNEIIVNGTSYGTDLVKVKDVAFNSDSNVLTFTKGDDTTFEVNFGDKLLSDADRAAVDSLKQALEGAGFTANYETELDPSLATVNDLGGIPAGTLVSKYKDKPLSRVIDDLLFPTVQPSATNPKATLSLRSYNSIQEVGAAGPTLNNFTTSFDQGTIKLGNNTVGNRAGAKTSDMVYANTESSPVTSTAGVVAVGTTNYYYKVNYAAGDEPKDSKGGTATTITQLPAGSVTSSKVAVYGVYPFYANTTAANINDGTFTKLALTNATTFTQKLPSENPSKHTFKLPHTVTKIEFENPLKANDWQVMNLSTQWTKTTERIDVNGTEVEYNVYTRSTSGYEGGFNYRVTYSK